MIKTKSKQYLICFFVTLFFSIGCGRNKDPFREVKFGKVNLFSFKNEMIDRGVLSEPEIDSTSFRYFLIHENDSSKWVVETNPGDYNFGVLRQLEINLSGDSLIIGGKHVYSRGMGARRKDDINKIVSIYKEWYGKPDSIRRDFKGMYDRFIWILQDYKLTIDKPKPQKDKFYVDSICYGGSVVYEMIGYEDAVEKIRDSIRSQNTPNDIISARTYNPRWEINKGASQFDPDIKFLVNLHSFTRKDREDLRGVVSVKFDIVIENEFGDELVRIGNGVYTPPEPLETNYSGIANSFWGYEVYSVDYYSNSYDAVNLESAREYSEINKIKAFVDIKAVVFEDGEVLK